MSAILEDAGLSFRLTQRDMPAVLTHPLQPCPHRLQCCNCCHIFSKGVTTEFLASMISGPAELYPESLSQNYTCSGCRAHRCTTRLWYLCGDHVAHAYVLPASIALHGRDYDKEQKRVSRGDATCLYVQEQAEKQNEDKTAMLEGVRTAQRPAAGEQGVWRRQGSKKSQEVIPEAVSTQVRAIGTAGALALGFASTSRLAQHLLAVQSHGKDAEVPAAGQRVRENKGGGRQQEELETASSEINQEGRPTARVQQEIPRAFSSEAKEIGSAGARALGFASTSRLAQHLYDFLRIDGRS